MEQEQKKRGRPPKNPAIGARSAAERQRLKREKQQEAISTRDSHELTIAECLAVLNGTRWRDGPIGKGAWEQLGKLLKYT